MRRLLLASMLSTIAAFAASAQTPKKIITLDKVVMAGEKVRLVTYAAVEPDCTSVGKTTIRVLKEPKSGKVEVAETRAFPNYDKDNVRIKCNQQEVDATGLWYTSNGGFIGKDLIELEVIFPRGEYYKGKISITVK